MQNPFPGKNLPSIGTMTMGVGLAIERLGEALWHEESEFTHDAAIRRFDFCFDAACAAIVMIAHEKGDALGRQYTAIFEYALRSAWISGEDEWITIQKDRTLPRTFLNNQAAEELFNRIKANYGRLIDFQRTLEAQDPEPPGRSSEPRKTIETAQVRHRDRNTPMQWHVASSEVFVGWPQPRLVGTARTMHDAMNLAAEWLLNNHG